MTVKLVNIDGRDYETIFQALLEINEGNEIKTHRWLKTPNSNCDGLRPKDLIAMGKADQILALLCNYIAAKNLRRPPESA